MPYAQLIVGAPGSGKSTYCRGMSEFLRSLGRNSVTINLDPANDYIPYECDINIFELITLENAMEAFSLGPNGGMLYCMEFLEKNFDWLKTKIQSIPEFEKKYFIFDCPGQIELFTDSPFLKQITHRLEKEMKFQMCSINLVDASYCTDAPRYISIVLLGLRIMIHLEFPHINILSKVDLLESYGNLQFDLNYYKEVQDLSYLLKTNKFSRKFERLNSALVELIEDFSLVTFETLAIENKVSVGNILKKIDTANGYVFKTLEENNECILNLAARAEYNTIS